MTAAERQRRVRAGLTRAPEEDVMPQEGALRRPVPLPATRESLVAQYALKRKRNINDYVEDILLKLWPDQNFMKYLDPIYDSQAVEGSLAADDLFAAQIIRQYATDNNSPLVANQNVTTIIKAMKVAQRRYKIGRQQREETAELLTETTSPLPESAA
jgi:hypothetical protein